MQKLSILSAVLIFGLISAGCETTKGIGKDLEKGGEAIQDTVQDLQD